MTRRDYELIARIIRDWQLDDEVVRAFAYAFREEHRGFKIDRFLAACKPAPDDMRRTHTGHAK